MSTDERKGLKELEKENRELRRTNEILKSASAFFARELDQTRTKRWNTSITIVMVSESDPSAGRLASPRTPVAPRSRGRCQTRRRGRADLRDDPGDQKTRQVRLRAKKTWIELVRQGHEIGRCRVRGRGQAADTDRREPRRLNAANPTASTPNTKNPTSLSIPRLSPV